MNRPLILLLWVAMIDMGCDRAEPPPAPPPPKSAVGDAPGWERRQYQPGGGDAVLLYAVFGKFDGGLDISRSRHRSGGPPEGVKVTQHSRSKAPRVFEEFEQGSFGRILDENPAFAKAVRSAPQLLLIRGTIPDPKNLIYLRDTIGVLAAALDSGGVGVLDSQTFGWWAPDAWRETFFKPDAPLPSHHVIILVSAEEGVSIGTEWVHTRGLRKFGRPDLSIHRVKTEHKDAVIDLCNRFIEMQAFGAIIPEGQPIKMATLPPGLTCHHAGNLDDLDFNNVHLEIKGP
ncbi:MAG TPA: hypothetical protein VKU80_17850 [Planctomycetota bacterium]|nr:hypothetical protein [Planctomycetota bacterium]